MMIVNQLLLNPDGKQITSAIWEIPVIRARNSRGPRGHWPPDFPNGPPVSVVGGPKSPLIFRTSYIYISMFGPPDFGLGPHVLKTGGPMRPPREISSFEPCAMLYSNLILKENVQDHWQIEKSYQFMKWKAYIIKGSPFDRSNFMFTFKLTCQWA